MSVNDSALKRLDKLISEKYPTLSNRHIEEALDNGLICGPEGRKIKKGQKLESLSGLVTEKLDEQLLKIKKGSSFSSGAFRQSDGRSRIGSFATSRLVIPMKSTASRPEK